MNLINKCKEVSGVVRYSCKEVSGVVRYSCSNVQPRQLIPLFLVYAIKYMCIFFGLLLAVFI